jgi:hypothetical protein
MKTKEVDTPPRKRIRLGSARDVRREQARLYVEWRAGKLDSQEMTRAANTLELIRRSIDSDELESGLTALRAELERHEAAAGIRR